MIYVVIATKAMILKTLFPKYKYIILTPYIEVLDENSFSNYRMEKKYCLLKTPLKILVRLWNTEMSVWKWRSGEW